MAATMGIRREDKNRWERRVPLVPEHVKEMKKKHGMEFVVQPSPIRVFPDSDYKEAGATVAEDLRSCDFIFAVKEVPIDLILPNKVYIYFSHVIKGQPHNMPMLQKLLDLKCTLIDYETIVDEKGRRLIFFGNFAGMAGMIDTLWAFGQRLSEEGAKTPFLKIHPAHRYFDLKAAKEDIAKVGEKIRRAGLPEFIHPAVFGFAGYGHVSQGAQEVFDVLPHQSITVQDLEAHGLNNLTNRNLLYKVIFKEEDMVTRTEKAEAFDLQEYYRFPERYAPKFDAYLPFLSVLVNCIYWDSRYPRLVTKEAIRILFGGSKIPRLRVIGDISCDVLGSIECTVKCTTPDQPVFVYDPQKDAAIDGVKGHGPVILAIDNLPCELPRESSTFFSKMLKPFIPGIMKADYSRSFEELDLDPAVKNAVIAHQGKLTPRYAHIKKYLKG